MTQFYHIEMKPCDTHGANHKTTLHRFSTMRRAYGVRCVALYTWKIKVPLKRENMGAQSLLEGLGLFFFFSVLLMSSGKGSADDEDVSSISFTLCEEFDGDVNIKINVKAKDKDGKAGKKLIARISGNNQRQTDMDGKIDQGEVKHVRVISKKNNQEICFQSLVFDTTIIIDQPTEFKDSCPLPPVENALPCKEFTSKLRPVLVCPQALTKLLKETGAITSDPNQNPGPNSFETPVYNTINDLGQASLDIADGLAAQFNKVVRKRMKVLKVAKGNDIAKMAGKLGKFSSFLSALGPLFSIFSGVLSIVTSFLTPNPFDEMVKYLSKEFDEVHRQLQYIKGDIDDLKKVVQSGNSLVAMSDAIRGIRYALRAYEPMVKSLSDAPVCGSRNLLKRREVVTFIEQYENYDVDNSLKDLYTADFGGVPEAPALLTTFMRAYYKEDPARVKQFMSHMSYYAYGGAMAHFAYRSLQCRMPKRRRPTNCKKDEDEKKKWMRMLWRFVKKADAMIAAVDNPAYGLHLHLQPELDELILKEVGEVAKKGENKNGDFPGVFEKVYDFIIGKLYDKNDWPEACIINLKEDRVVIIQVAQLLSNVRVYGSNFKPFGLGYEYTRAGLEKTKFKVRHVGRGFRHELETGSDKYNPIITRGIERYSCRCQEGPKLKESCNVTAGPGGDFEAFGKVNYPPEEEFPEWPRGAWQFNDRILYFMFNPSSYWFGTDPAMVNMRVVTPITVINMLPIYAFYKDKTFLKNFCYDADVIVACLHYFKEYNGNFYDMKCIAPDASDPNRPNISSDWEKFVAFVGE